AVLLDEGAQSRRLLAGEFGHLIIVFDLAARLFLGRERDVEVVVEVVAVGRHPFELPAHAFLVGLDFGEGRARRSPNSHRAGRDGYWRRRNGRRGTSNSGNPASSRG